jgi:hypothetical protein
MGGANDSLRSAVIRSKSGRSAALLLVAFTVSTACLAQSPLAQQMEAVEQIRGRKFATTVKNVSIDRSALQPMLREQMAKEVPYSLEEWVAALRALQLVDVEAKDVLPKLLSLYESQVLAFYDAHSHTYYSIKQLPPALKDLGDPKLMAEMVAVHELMHAMQDQHFRIGERTKALRNDTDAGMAYHALLEGEAAGRPVVLHGSQRFGLNSAAGVDLDQVIKNDAMVNALLSAAANEQGAIDPSTPKYFVESLKFPYLQGIKFVVAAYRRGGWKELDRIHADPPRSTREVLFPEEYFARKNAPDAFDPKPLSTMPNLITVEHLGQFNWGFLVGAENARGWVNDRVAILRGASPTVLAETKWESPERAAAFATAYESFLKKRGIDARVVRDGATVKAAYGPDAKAIESFIPAPKAKAAA